MSKFASFVPDTNVNPVPVTGWFRVRDEQDPDGFCYASLPPSDQLVSVSNAMWEDREGRAGGAYVVDQNPVPTVVAKSA